tara:strand:- start:3 stop:671 length:669 start_codon:yes stop_codon:yes gene_type:complete
MKGVKKHELLERRRIIRDISYGKKNAPALFLDRDGVLIEDKHHITDPNQVELCEGALDLVLAACRRKLAVVLITNQSGISRNIFDWDTYESITNRILSILGTPSPITAIYANGYSDLSPDAYWRKPNPGMLIEAKTELNIDLNKSILIGDRMSDLIAGASAGVSQLIHVLTGHGKKERLFVQQSMNASNQLVVGDLSAKVTLIDSLKSFPMNIIYDSNLKSE